MKYANKSFSLVQPLLMDSNFFSSPLYPSGYSGQTQMIALISTLFLCCYACGQMFVGQLADKYDLRLFLSGAMIAAGFFTLAFGF